MLWRRESVLLPENSSYVFRNIEYSHCPISDMCMLFILLINCPSLKVSGWSITKLKIK